MAEKKQKWVIWLSEGCFVGAKNGTGEPLLFLSKAAATKHAVTWRRDRKWPGTAIAVKWDPVSAQ